MERLQFVDTPLTGHANLSIPWEYVYATALGENRCVGVFITLNGRMRRPNNYIFDPIPPSAIVSDVDGAIAHDVRSSFMMPALMQFTAWDKAMRGWILMARDILGMKPGDEITIIILNREVLTRAKELHPGVCCPSVGFRDSTYIYTHTLNLTGRIRKHGESQSVPTNLQVWDGRCWTSGRIADLTGGEYVGLDGIILPADHIDRFGNFMWD